MTSLHRPLTVKTNSEQYKDQKNIDRQDVLEILTQPRISLRWGPSLCLKGNNWEHSIKSFGGRLKLQLIGPQCKIGVYVEDKSKRVYIDNIADYKLRTLVIHGHNLTAKHWQRTQRELQLRATDSVEIESRIKTKHLLICGNKFNLRVHAILNVKSVQSGAKFNSIDGTIFCRSSDLNIFFDGDVALGTDASIGKYIDNNHNSLQCSSLKLITNGFIVNYGCITATNFIYMECINLHVNHPLDERCMLGFDTPQLVFDAVVKNQNDRVSDKRLYSSSDIYEAINRRDIPNVIQILNGGNIDSGVAKHVAKLLGTLRKMPKITAQIQKDINILQKIDEHIKWKLRQFGTVCAPVIKFTCFNDLKDLYQLKSSNKLHLDVLGSVTLRTSSPRWETGTLSGRIGTFLILKADSSINAFDQLSIGKSFQNEGYCTIKNGGLLHIGDAFKSSSIVKCFDGVLCISADSFETKENSVIDGKRVYLVVRGIQQIEQCWFGRVCCDELNLIVYQQQTCQATFSVKDSLSVRFQQLGAQLSIKSQLKTLKGPVTVAGGYGRLIFNQIGSINCASTIFIDQIEQLVNYGSITSIDAFIKLFHDFENHASVSVSKQLAIGCQRDITNSGTLHALDISVSCSKIDNDKGQIISDRSLRIVQWAKEDSLLITGSISCPTFLKIQCAFTQKLIFEPNLSCVLEQLEIACPNGLVDLVKTTNTKSIYIRSKSGLLIRQKCKIDQLTLIGASESEDLFIFQIDENVQINQLNISEDIKSSKIKIIGHGSLTIQQLHVKNITELSFELKQPVEVVDANIQVTNELLIEGSVSFSGILYVKSKKLSLCRSGNLSIHQGEINADQIHIQGKVNAQTTACSICGEDIRFEISSTLSLFNKTQSEYKFQLMASNSIKCYGLIEAEDIPSWGISSNGLVIIDGSLTSSLLVIKGYTVSVAGKIANKKNLAILAVESVIFETTCNLKCNEMAVTTSNTKSSTVEIFSQSMDIEKCTMMSNLINFTDCIAQFNGVSQYKGETIKLLNSELKFYHETAEFHATATFETSSKLTSDNKVHINAPIIVISGSLMGPGYTTEVPEQEKRTFRKQLEDFLGVTTWNAFIDEVEGNNQNGSELQKIEPIIGYLINGYKVKMNSAIIECSVLCVKANDYLSITNDCHLSANEVSIETAWGFISSELLGTKCLQLTSHGLLNSGKIKSNLAIQLNTHLAFINMGVIDCPSVRSVSLIFINLFHIYAPRFICRSIISLFLLGITRSFHFQQMSILHFEGVHVTVPTIPTWNDLTDIESVFSAVLNTAKNFCPPQIRSALNIVTSIKSLVVCIPYGCLLVANLVKKIKRIKRDGMNFDVITALIEIICNIVPVYSSARSFLETALRTKAETGNSDHSTSIQEYANHSSLENTFDVATALATNLIGPRYSYTAVASAKFGLCVSHSISETGILGHNNGLTLTTGTQIFDYAYSFNQNGISLACGDIICSARYLQQHKFMMSARNISLEGHEVSCKLVRAYRKLGIMATKQAVVENAIAGTILATVDDGNLSINNASTGYLEAKATDVHIAESNVHEGIVRGKQEVFVNNSNIGKCLLIKSDGIASISDIAGDEAILVASEVDLVNTNNDLHNLTVITKKIPGIENLISHTGEYAGLKIRDNLDLAVSDQAVRFSTDLLLSHGFILSAADININANVTSTANDITLKTTSGDINILSNTEIHADDGTVVLHSEGDFTMNKNSSIFSSKIIDVASKGKIELNDATVKGQDVYLSSKGDQKHFNSNVSSSNTTCIESTDGYALLKGTRAEADNLLYIKASDIDIQSSEHFIAGPRGSQVKHYDRTVLKGGTGEEYQLAYAKSDGNLLSDTGQVGLIIESKGKMSIDTSTITSQSDNFIKAGTIELKADSYQYTESKVTTGFLSFNEKTVKETYAHIERPEVFSADGRNFITATDGSIQTIGADIKSANGNLLIAKDDIQLTDIVEEHTLSTSKSSFWGFLSTEKTEKHQLSVGTNLVAVEPNSQTVIASKTGSIQLMGSTIQTPGHLFASAGKDIIATDHILDHSIDIMQKGFSFDAELFHKDSAVVAMEDLTNSGGVVPGMITMAMHTLPEVQVASEQIRNTTSEDLASLALDRSGISNPSIDIKYRTIRMSKRYQTLAQSGVFVGGNAEINTDSLTINNAAQLQVQGDLLLDVQNFSLNGIHLQNSCSEQTSSASLSFSLKSGVTDMKISHSESKSANTTVVNQNTFVGGTATFRENTSAILNGANVYFNAAEGSLKDMKIISLQDEYHSEEKSATLSTVPTISLNVRSQEEKYVNEKATLTIGHTTSKSFTINTLNLHGGTMIMMNDDHVQIDHVAADEVYDRREQSSFNNTNLQLAVLKENSVAVHRPTLIGNNTEILKVEGPLNTNASSSYESIKKEHMEVHVDISAAALQRLFHPHRTLKVSDIPVEKRDDSKLHAVFSELAYKTSENQELISAELQSYSNIDSKLIELLDGWETEQVDQRAVAFVNHDSNRIVVAYRGTHDLVDGMSDVGILTTGIPLLHNASAEQLFQDMRQAYPEYSISVTGHSLGGRRAELIAMQYDVPCFSYNPGAGLPTLQAVEQNNANSDTVQIYRFLVHNDVVSVMNSLQGAQGPNIVNVRVPRQDGLNPHTIRNFTDVKNSPLWKPE